MEQLLQQFEKPIADKSGVSYTVFLYGRNRPGDTWQGWLVFERSNDGKRFATDVETTQPNADAIHELPYAHADTIRALEDLEKQGGLLVRRTEEGSDWLFLTEAGAVAAGVERAPRETELSKPML